MALPKKKLSQVNKYEICNEYRIRTYNFDRLAKKHGGLPKSYLVQGTRGNPAVAYDYEEISQWLDQFLEKKKKRISLEDISDKHKPKPHENSDSHECKLAVLFYKTLGAIIKPIKPQKTSQNLKTI